jgi:hypothetical protein
VTETLPARTPARPTTGKALAVIALVAGIVAVVAILWGWAAIVVGAGAIVVGIVALRKRQSKGMAVTGIVTGSVGVVGGTVMVIVMAMLLAALTAHAEEILDEIDSGVVVVETTD